MIQIKKNEDGSFYIKGLPVIRPILSGEFDIVSPILWKWMGSRERLVQI